MKAPQGSNIQVVEDLSPSHAIAVVDLERPDIEEQQVIDPARLAGVAEVIVTNAQLADIHNIPVVVLAPLGPTKVAVVTLMMVTPSVEGVESAGELGLFYGSSGGQVIFSDVDVNAGTVKLLKPDYGQEADIDWDFGLPLEGVVNQPLVLSSVNGLLVDEDVENPYQLKVKIEYSVFDTKFTS